MHDERKVRKGIIFTFYAVTYIIFSFQAHNDNVLSKAVLAQRTRREREKHQKLCSAYQLGQRLRRERERSKECINPRQYSLTQNW